MNINGILYLSNDDVKKVLDLGRAIEITEQALRDHSEGRVIWSTPEDLAIKPETRLAVLGHRLRPGQRTCSRLSHSFDQSGRRQPGCVASAARPEKNSDSQRPRRRRDSRDHGRRLVSCRAHRGGSDSRHARARAQRVVRHGDARRRRYRPRRRAGDGQGFRIEGNPRHFAYAGVARELRAEKSAKNTASMCVPVESTEAALKGADLVVSATTTSTPFVKDSWLGAGITVYSIGKNQEMESDSL